MSRKTVGPALGDAKLPLSEAQSSELKVSVALGIPSLRGLKRVFTGLTRPRDHAFISTNTVLKSALLQKLENPS